MRIIDYSPTWQSAVIKLWHECGLVRSWNDPAKDIARKTNDKMGKFFLLIEQTNSAEDTLIGSVMAGYDGHRGSINYLAIAKVYQQKGYAKKLMNHCETYLKNVGCPKINLCVRTTNLTVIDFYQTLGYQTDPVVCMGKRLIADD